MNLPLPGPPRTLIVGAGRRGRRLAIQLRAQGQAVVLIEHDPALVEAVRRLGLHVCTGDGRDVHVLQQAGAAQATAVICTTASDLTNLRVCQTARAHFGIRDLAAYTNDAASQTLYAALGIRPLTPPGAPIP